MIHRILFDYLNSPKMQRLSSNTSRCYSYALNRFIAVTGITKPEEITQDTIEQFDAQLCCKNKTMNSYIAAIKSFLEYCQKHGIPAMDPDDLERHKEEKTISRVPTDEEVRTIIENTDTIRDRAIIMLLIFAGLRPGEVCSLNRRDVLIAEKQAYIYRGKGEKDRLVFFNQETANVLSLYLSSRKDKHEALFIISDRNGSHGGGRSGERITVVCVQRIIRKLAPVSDISPRKLRTYFATMCINRNIPITAVKEYMGHEDIRTTMGYVRMSGDYLRREYDKGIK